MRIALLKILVLVSIAVSACAVTERDRREIDIDGLAQADAAIDRCDSLFRELASGYTTSPENLEDIDSLARKLTENRSPITTMLTLGDRSVARQTVGTFLDARDAIFREVRTNAVGVLGDEECGSAADEYLAEALFQEPKPPSESQLFRILADETRTVSFRQYLLLRLMRSLNSAAFDERGNDT